MRNVLETVIARRSQVRSLVHRTESSSSFPLIVRLKTRLCYVQLPLQSTGNEPQILHATLNQLA